MSCQREHVQERGGGSTKVLWRKRIRWPSGHPPRGRTGPQREKSRGGKHDFKEHGLLEKESGPQESS